ncbi:glycosyl transferase [Tetragenococcus halophilus]|uniref:glycosyltransferase family 2 protein n=1 Tax=Tetragenococcus TaxID=51668 RepID=UPI0019284939|nr:MULTISPECIES: glycosyltransferase [Tetragenococcus]MCF1627486.1 glycosyltransferase [Tetragenococcus koreensis]GEQ37769.1 glycosyl transferase [Tetragenococcus halophilus]GEQ40032.1 glycosyl transferase [Tetragenococcus halophilus]GEQ42146.1 glycosyl transferase [Tetragenococcus halophilus]GEQ44479.1 glycosyl transferase [Tetragenococcus halophilus]
MDISVITTVYNSERYIKECVESVQQQVLPQNVTFEHVIVDDGSTDETEDIIKQLQKKYSNINYLKFGKLGRAKALNKAIDNTKGNYIANLDSDDIFLPNKLWLQYKFMESHEECDLLCTESTTFNDNISLEFREKTTYKVIDAKLLKKNIVNHSSVLFRKSQLLKIGMYDESRVSQVDLELWLRCLYNGLTIYRLDTTLTGKRIHENQSFERSNRIKYLTASAKVKLRYIFKMRKYRYLPAVGVRFFGGMLPENFRAKFRN